MSGLLVSIKSDGTQSQERWEGKGKKARPGYEKIQALLDGGYFQMVNARLDGKVREAYIDEDGIMKRLQVNPFAMAILTDLWKPSRIWGTMVIWVPDPKLKKENSNVMVNAAG